MLLLVEVFIYFQMVLENPQLTLKYNLVFLLVCILANIGAFITYKYLSKVEKIKVENLFLIIALIYGGLYLMFIPAILGTDELPHFLRPYQISVGDVIVKNPEKNETKIPKALNNLISEYVMASRYDKKYFLESVDYSKTDQLWNGNVTSIDYSPIPYLPQIIGFWGARLLHLSPMLTMYFVRLLNFITFVVLAYFAIKLIPTKKVFALILYTSPAVLSIVSTCSGDTFALGLFLLLIAYILNLTKTKRKLTKSDYIILALASIGISTYKVFYVLYTLLLFLIPKESFGDNKKKKVLILSIIIFISLFLDFAWFISTSVGSKVSGGLTSKQIMFILTNPLKYVFIFINTYINDIYYYATNIVAGTEMCYGLARMNQLFIFAYLFIFVLSYFDGSKQLKISLAGKILIIFVSLAIFGLVSTTLYLDWTSYKLGIGALKIIGIQSRYFWPLIIPIVVIMPYAKRKYKDINLLKCSVILNTILLINCISSLLIVCFPR